MDDSEDHRGTPESPGRVVTLIERSYWKQLGETTTSPDPDKVFGAAYRIPSAHVEEVKRYLDVREINGYSIQYTTVYPVGEPITSGSALTRGIQLPSGEVTQPIEKCLVYIGMPDNAQFLGIQPQDAVAEVIANTIGPSGKNDEYLFMLEQALALLDGGGECPDQHVKGLADSVRKLQGA